MNSAIPPLMVMPSELGSRRLVANVANLGACDVLSVDRSASRTSPNPTHALREFGGCEDTPILTPEGATALLSQSYSPFLTACGTKQDSLFR